MDDAALADEIIARLNRLIEDPEIRKDIGNLLEERVACYAETMGHPSIQCHPIEPGSVRVKPGARPPAGLLGFLGVLNGFVGVIQGGPREGWGYISAYFDDDRRLVRFERTV